MGIIKKIEPEEKKNDEKKDYKKGLLKKEE